MRERPEDQTWKTSAVWLAEKSKIEAMGRERDLGTQDGCDQLMARIFQELWTDYRRATNRKNCVRQKIALGRMRKWCINLELDFDVIWAGLVRRLE